MLKNAGKNRSITGIAVASLLIVLFAIPFFLQSDTPSEDNTNGYLIELSYHLTIKTSNVDNYTVMLPVLKGWDDLFQSLKVKNGSAVLEKTIVEGRAMLTVKGNGSVEIYAAKEIPQGSITTYSFYTEANGTAKVYGNYSPSNGTLHINSVFSVIGVERHGLDESSEGGNEYQIFGNVANSWQYMRVNEKILG